MIKRVLLAGLSTVVVLFLVELAFAQLSTEPPQPPKHEETAKKSESETTKYNPLNRFWNWTTGDAVSFYTFVLSIFTGVLGGTAIVQGYLLKRSVDILSQSERAQMFIIVHSEHLRMYSHLAKRRDQNDDVVHSESADVAYSFKNYGKTPAIIREISARLVCGARPPTDPVYVPTDQVLQEHMIGSGDSTAVITPLDNIQPHRSVLDEGMTPQQAYKITHARSYIWFYGRILYDDIFGQEHEHRFLWRYGGAHGFRPNYEHPKYIRNS